MTIFESYRIKNLNLKNKVVMAPMCQYSAEDGFPNDWHTTHYASRAAGGTGLIIVEMTNVEPDGRITDHCLGLWSDSHISRYKTLVDAIHQNGAKAGIQIAHAGRKAVDADTPVSSSPIPYDDSSKTPHELNTDETRNMIEKFRLAAGRAVSAGFDFIEIHGAHGYLIHQFSSPRTNTRSDQYGEDLSLFGCEVIRAVKEDIPDDMPLAIRISAKEFAEGGYDTEHGIYLAKQFKKAGADIIHVSAGGEGSPSPERFPGASPGYMVPFARAVKEGADIPVIAVGMLDDVNDARKVIEDGSADLVALGRALLRDPYWVLNHDDSGSFIPRQYTRGYQ